MLITSNNNGVYYMALKQVHIAEYAEPALEKIIEARREANKLGPSKSITRQGIVADALLNLLKKEVKA